MNVDLKAPVNVTGFFTMMGEGQDVGECVSVRDFSWVFYRRSSSLTLVVWGCWTLNQFAVWLWRVTALLCLAPLHVTSSCAFISPGCLPVKRIPHAHARVCIPHAHARLRMVHVHGGSPLDLLTWPSRETMCPIQSCSAVVSAPPPASPPTHTCRLHRSLPDTQWQPLGTIGIEVQQTKNQAVRSCCCCKELHLPEVIWRHTTRPDQFMVQVRLYQVRF